MKGGLDAHVAGLTGHPVGPNFRFALTNAIFKDNRIPPRGFNNTSFAAVGAAPVGYDYTNGQHWDDTYFPIVTGWPVEARVRLYYQATSREYIEFLRDNNPNPGNPNNAGQVLYQQWLAHGKGAPVLMAESLIPVLLKGDVNGDRQVTIADLPHFVNVLLGIDTDPRKICVADMNSDEAADGLDVPRPPGAAIRAAAVRERVPCGTFLAAVRSIRPSPIAAKPTEYSPVAGHGAVHYLSQGTEHIHVIGFVQPF
jgi:hypothetical protein